MIKPEKKKLNTPIKTELQSHENYVKDGYNLAIDEYEKFLPSEEELLDLIIKWKDIMGFSGRKMLDKQDYIDLAKVIAKRIGK